MSYAIAVNRVDLLIQGFIVEAKENGLSITDKYGEKHFLSFLPEESGMMDCYVIYEIKDEQVGAVANAEVVFWLLENKIPFSAGETY